MRILKLWKRRLTGEAKAKAKKDTDAKVKVETGMQETAAKEKYAANLKI